MYKFLNKNDIDFDFKYLFLLFLASITRLAISLVIAFLALNVHSLQWFPVILFGAAIVLYALFYYQIHMKINNTIDKMIFSLRMRIARKILTIDFVHWDKFEKTSFLDIFIKNLTIISQNRNFIKKLIVTTSYGLAGIICLAWFSFLTFLIFIITIFMFTHFYILLLEKIQVESSKQQKLEEKLLSSFDGTLSGFKQIKMNTKRSKELLRDTINYSQELEQQKIELNTIQDSQTTALRVYIYLILAIIAFPPFEVSQSKQVTLLILTVSFVGPFIWAVFGFIPNITKFFIALKTVYEIEEKIDALAETTLNPDQKQLSFSKINLRNVMFNYPDQDFAIGPINFEIQKGKIIFIVGNNGCGKSTLGKIIIGLLRGEKGEILLNDSTVIGKDNIVAYRSLFSAIFAESYLFSKLYGVKKDNFHEYLEEMALHDKVSLDGNKLIGTDLSTGQRKRLAFLISFLEDKQIYFFDEPASDQDPKFKEYFYTKIIQKLIEKEKTVIIISHDEEYFQVADQVIHLENGNVSNTL